MKLATKVKDELFNELYLAMKDYTRKMAAEEEWSKTYWYMRGAVLGLQAAMEIVAGWHLPNRGKVRADVYRCDTAEHKSKSSSNP